MPSRRRGRRPWASEHPELDLERARGGSRVEHGPDGDWVVRTVGAANATKAYLCPGCRQEIPPGTAHLVAWQQDHLLGPEAAVGDRRHWHTGCWRHRGSRR
ncbi:hypothetical protein GXB85_06960 [Cellulomonas sp. APG4]|uniref:hypothetical protein n=1 Tax=Cellulomonas sp. APG4 TaxID=1538656 RepID=UPI00137B41AF|nr:hypothetical protein [Cellulomonas sp. APG4]NCT90683.1 hypothetical protein [Cellulomonas sp. APG4]